MGLLFILAGTSVFLLRGHGYVGEPLELLQVCEGPFRELQEGRCDFPRDVSAKRGLISPGRESLLFF